MSVSRLVSRTPLAKAAAPSVTPRTERSSTGTASISSDDVPATPAVVGAGAAGDAGGLYSQCQGSAS